MVHWYSSGGGSGGGSGAHLLQRCSVPPQLSAPPGVRSARLSHKGSAAECVPAAQAICARRAAGCCGAMLSVP